MPNNSSSNRPIGRTSSNGGVTSSNLCTSSATSLSSSFASGNLTINGTISANGFCLNEKPTSTSSKLLSVRLDDAYLTTDPDDIFAQEETFIKESSALSMDDKMKCLFNDDYIDKYTVNAYRLLSVLGTKDDAEAFFRDITNPNGRYCLNYIRKIGKPLGEFPYKDTPMALSPITGNYSKDGSPLAALEYFSFNPYNEPHNNRVTAQIIFTRLFNYGGYTIYFVPMLISFMWDWEKSNSTDDPKWPDMNPMKEYRKALLESMEKSDNPELQDMILINIELFKEIGMIGDIMMLGRLRNLDKINTYFSVTNAE